MHLHQLRVENFRGFESLTLDFHREVTVLVGDNGSGKISVLEAIVLVLANSLRAPDDDAGPFGDFATTDIRASATETRLSVTLDYRGDRGEQFGGYLPERDGSGQFATWSSHFGGEHDFRDPLRTSESEPIAVYYDVDRHTRDSTPGSRDAVYRTPRDAWNDAWSATAGFDELFQWFREREDIENAERVELSSFRDPQLEAVRHAIEALLSRARASSSSTKSECVQMLQDFELYDPASPTEGREPNALVTA
ncbi:MAG: AAA family ATPase [Nannocystaceae bacterium]